MRLAFLGTPEAAVPSLKALLDDGHEVALVITRPDRKRGRGGALVASPVKVAAQERGLTVSHRLADLYDLDVERAVVVAFGALIPASLLDRVPMLNVHFSLLPRWRGAAPVQRAILAGDEVTGVSIISLEATLDTGPVHLARRLDVGDKSAWELTAELADLGALALVEVLRSRELLANPVVQRGSTTYAEKLTKETFHLTPECSSVLAARVVRLGGAYFFLDDKRVGVVAARESVGEVAEGVVANVEGNVVLGLRDGVLVLERVRPEGASTMAADAWWRGRHAGARQLEWS